MNDEALVDYYVCKLNEECLYDKDDTTSWKHSDISDINDMVRYCNVIYNHGIRKEILCASCERNLKEYKKLVEGNKPHVMTKSEYLCIVNNLQDIKSMLTEMRQKM